MLTLADFKRIDLRVAQITAAERVPKTDRLIRLTVNLGGEERTLVAGLGAHYQPQDLIDLKVVVVANLEPAVIRGIESNGMILAAGCSDGADIALLTVNKDVSNGARVE